MTKTPKVVDQYPALKGKVQIPDIDMLEFVHGHMDRAFAAGIKWVERKPKSIKDLYTTYLWLRRLRDITDNFKKAIDRSLDVLNTRIEEHLNDVEQTSFNTEMGYRFGISYRTYAGIKADVVLPNGKNQISDKRREAAKKWLRSHHLGSLIVETINASTLAAEAKRRAEANEKQLPDNLFNVYNEPTISVTKIQAKT